MIIDANNLSLGRMASYAAKKALLGNHIDIVNCEKSVIVGKRKEILGRYHQMLQRGVHSKGPFLPRMPDRFVKRTIRGMLPYRIAKGRAIFKNIRCYIGIPDTFKNGKIEALENISISKTNAVDYLKVKDICNSLGGKV